MSSYVYLHWDHKYVPGLRWVNPDMWSPFCKEGSEWWVTSPLTSWLCCPELCPLCTQALLTLFWVLDHAKLIPLHLLFPLSGLLSPNPAGYPSIFRSQNKCSHFIKAFLLCSQFCCIFSLGQSFSSFISSLAVITFLCCLTWGMSPPATTDPEALWGKTMSVM